MSTEVRAPAVAGRFYPADPVALASEIDAMLAGAEAARAGASPKAIVAPHAGYVYSGPVAASAYRLLRPWAESVAGSGRIVLLGPAHRVRLRGLALPGVRALATPLGEVPVDGPLVRAVSGLPDVVVSPEAHALEHSLEVHLPFLQRVVGRFTVLPVAVGAADPGAVAALIEAAWGGEETRIVVSSDLSHYLPYVEARRVDEATADAIASARSVDPDRACGAYVLNGLARVVQRRGLRGERIDLRNSGDTSGSRGEVVGYGAFGFWEEAPP